MGTPYEYANDDPDMSSTTIKPEPVKQERVRQPWQVITPFRTPLGKRPKAVGAPVTKRALRRAVAFPGKPTKVFDDPTIFELKKRAYTMGSIRQAAMRDFMLPSNGGQAGYKTSADAMNAWAGFLNKQTAEVQAAFGSDNATKKLANYHTYGPNKVGKAVPYYIENGVLRGGRSFSGVDAAHGAMHLPPTIQRRSLVSAIAKYVNPTMAPATRLIKFIHASFAPRKTTTEGLSEFAL